MHVHRPARVPARGQAHDVGRVRADVADAGRGLRLQALGIQALAAQDRPLVVRTAERVLADRTRPCGRRGGTARSAGPGCGRGPFPPHGRPVAGRSRPRPSRTAAPRRAGSRAPCARRPARTGCARAGPGRSAPGDPRRVAARWPRPAEAGRASMANASRPVAARWRASKAGPSVAAATSDTPRPFQATVSGPIGESMCA